MAYKVQKEFEPKELLEEMVLLTSQKIQNFIIDMTEVNHLSSSQIGVLIRISKSIKLKIIASPPIYELLDDLCLTKFIQVEKINYM